MAIASSVDLLVRYANWCVSRVGGRQALMCLKTSFSKHLVMTGVSAMGRKSLRLVVGDFLGIGMIVADFKQDGITACSRDRLKMSVKTCDSWLAHALSTFPGTPSGPAAFLGLTALSTRLTSCTSRVSGGVLEADGGCSGGWSDVAECCVEDSKRAKKLFSSSANAASESPGVTAQPL